MIQAPTGVAHRLFARIAIALVVVFVGLGAAAIVIDSRTRLSDLENRARTVTRLLAVSATDALARGERLGLRDVETIVAAYPATAYSVFFDPAGDVLMALGVPFIVDAGPGWIEGGRDEHSTSRISVAVAESVVSKDGVVEVIERLPGGEALVVGFTTTGVVESAKRSAIFIALVLLSALVLVFFVTWRSVERFIAVPVGAITTAADALAQGDLQSRVPIVGDDELARLSSDFNEMAEELERAQIAERTFFSSVTHELRAPSKSIRGFVELLLDHEENLSPRGRLNLDRIQGLAERQEELLNEVLDLAKLESARLEVKIARALVLPIIDDVREQARSLVGGRGGVDVVSTVVPDDLVIETDEKRLRQILLNLAANAVRFTPTGQVRILATDTGDEFITFVVEDEGIGISDADQTIVFDAFRQAAGSDRAGGSGLGLTIVKQLTELLGGEVKLTSVLHEGTRITVRLPKTPPTPAT